MKQENLEKLYTQTNDLLTILKNYNIWGNFNLDSLKECVFRIIDYIVENKTEAENLKAFMNETDFWTAPASTRFHGNFKSGLALHSVKVLEQALIFTKPIVENFITSPENNNFDITAEDIFVSCLVHDFCKTGFYGVEYRNTKDIQGNWVKQPFYKTRSENRNLGHGNESVLMLLKIMPSYINKRYVLEAVSRHMGFSDLSESESFNYSNFLQNPLVVLIQLADETAAQWFNC